MPSLETLEISSSSSRLLLESASSSYLVVLEDPCCDSDLLADFPAGEHALGLDSFRFRSLFPKLEAAPEVPATVKNPDSLLEEELDLLLSSVSQPSDPLADSGRGLTADFFVFLVLTRKAELSLSLSVSVTVRAILREEPEIWKSIVLLQTSAYIDWDWEIYIFRIK